MRSRTAAAAAALLAAAPFLWLLSFAIIYRCDLGHYARVIRSGDIPGWLTAWELAVTLACVLIAAIVAPKVARLWSRGLALTRGEWISLGLVAILVAGAVVIAPAAMQDPRAQFDALLNPKIALCVH